MKFMNLTSKSRIDFMRLQEIIAWSFPIAPNFELMIVVCLFFYQNFVLSSSYELRFLNLTMEP